MSNFQNYYSFLIDIGSTVAQWQAEFKQRLTDNGWQVIAEHIPVGSVLATQRGILDVIPPIAETIGNASFHEVTRFTFTSTSVSVTSFIRPVAAQGTQSFTLTNGAASTNTMSFYIEGVLFSLAGSSGGNTAAVNATAFYNMMVASTHELAQMFNWSVNGAIITATAKGVKPVVQVMQAVLSASSRLALGGQSNAMLILNKTYQSASSNVTTDFTNGFIYFLTINSRSLHLSTKTTVSYYGPIYAHYGEHASAIAQTPPNCIPIELVIGYSGNGTTRVFGNGRITHTWGTTVNYSVDVIPAFDSMFVALAVKTTANNYSVFSDLTSFIRSGGVAYSHNSQPYNTDLWVSPFGIDITQNWVGNYYGEVTLFNGNSVLPNMLRAKNWEYLCNSNIYTVATCPAINLEDVFTANFTATNESLHLVRNLTTNSVLQTSMDAVSAYPNVDVTDATFFAVSGTFIVDSETFEYTGKSGNTLTGVTRAKYGTTMAVHDTTDIVYQGNWMVKINSALHMAGTTKPLN